MIIAVDFDDTLSINCKPNMRLIGWLLSQQRQGATVILNTCRNGARLRDAMVFCRNHGLIFAAVNANLPGVVKMLGYDPRKIYADVYIDDKAMIP